MAAEKIVKLANLGEEMFEMGLSLQGVRPCTTPGGLQLPLDPSCDIRSLGSFKVTRYEKSDS